MVSDELKAFLDEKVTQYNRPGFIENDPVSIPHQFSQQQDIEIAGLFAAVLAWGQRKTIINKCNELMEMMDRAPYDFVLHASDRDLVRLEQFKHRTFNATDTLYFVHFLKSVYQQYESLEELFAPTDYQGPTTERALVNFYERFVSLDNFPARTAKHVQNPLRKSACKRMNMYLRWMVRDDDNGVDFGVWKRIKPRQLICPCDLHVDRVARKLGLIKRKQTDWQTALELTATLREMDGHDPVKYDFALFGLGIEEKF